MVATVLAGLLLAATASARCPNSGDMTAAFAAAGPHPVGTRVAMLVDASRPTPPNGTFAGAPSRMLPTQVWYPAAPGTAGMDAPLDSAGAPYPIIIYGHAAFDSKMGEAYLLEHLASHGYVVAAPDFPLTKSNAPGGITVTDIPQQPADLRFVLASVPDIVPGVGDGPVGVAGLSGGAITTLLVTYDRTLREPRIRAALPIAPPYACALTRRFYRTTHVPLLIMYGDADALAPPHENGERAFHRARGPRHLVTIHNGSHLGFVGFADAIGGDRQYDVIGCVALRGILKGDYSLPPVPNERRDGIAYSPSVCPDPCQQDPTMPALAAERQHEIARITATAFFDGYLKKDAAARCFLRTGLARENADVSTESRH